MGKNKEVVQHPGVVLKELIEATGQSVEAIQNQLGLAKGTLYSIMGCRALFTADTALKIARGGFGPDAEYWMKLKTDYELAVARGQLEK